MVKSFVDMLPPESATVSAVRDDLGEQKLAELARERDPGGPRSLGSWSQTDMRLAVIIDKLSWLAYAVYHSQGAKPETPDPYPRPGVLSRQNTTMRAQDFAYLMKIRERNHAAWAAAEKAGVS